VDRVILFGRGLMYKGGEQVGKVKLGWKEGKVRNGKRCNLGDRVKAEGVGRYWGMNGYEVRCRKNGRGIRGKWQKEWERV